MIVMQRFFSHVSIKKIKPENINHAFLNILMTDIRPESIKQKLQSFYTVVDCCLRNDQSVNLVVVFGDKGNEEVERIYYNCLANFLNRENFNLIFIRSVTRWDAKLLAFINMARCFIKLKGSLAQRFNYACLSTLIRLRIDFFQKIYSLLPCDNWLGLTGGVELPAFQYKRHKLRKGGIINALQFGQASDDQQHFSGYSVDTVFVYDAYSKQVFKDLGMNIKDIVVSGSPEFEYQSNLICNEKILNEDKLNIVFIDQPVRQRGEYSEDFLRDFYAMLQLLNNDQDLKVKVKPHPRGSAFNGDPWSDFSITDDLGDSFSRVHIVIGFFSNLCDLALARRRITFYVGCDSILSSEKRDWITSQDGYMVNDIGFLLNKIMSLKDQYTKIANQIMLDDISESLSSSEIIFNKMVKCNDAETIS